MNDVTVDFQDLDHCGAEIMRRLTRDLGPGEELMAVVAFGLRFEPVTRRSQWRTTVTFHPTLQREGLPLTHEELYRDVIEAAQRIIESIQQ